MIAVDTNVLVYAESVGRDVVDDDARFRRALELLNRLEPDMIAIPVQALGELHAVLTRKRRFTRLQAAAACEQWAAFGRVLASTPTAMHAAFDLAARHRLQIFDALILAVAEENGCSVLLSEDLQAGFTWRGLRVVDPFGDEAASLA